MKLLPLLLGVMLLVLIVGSGETDASPKPNEHQQGISNTNPLCDKSPGTVKEKEQSKARKDLILKMLAGILNGVDVDRDAVAFSDFENTLERKLEEEPLMLAQSSHITQRDRKTPCKNFFWKTFTAC